VQSETRLKEKVLSDLKTLPNTWATKIQQVSIGGTPDIIACIRGYFVAIELKRNKKEKPTGLQEYNMVRILKADGQVFVVYPENWAKIFRHLERLSLYGNIED